jgi:hypothetical protein
MNLQHVAPGPVQPSHNDDFVTSRETVKTRRSERPHLKPGVGSAFRTLFGRLAARLEDGSDHSNRPNLRTSAIRRARPHPRSLRFLDRHR